MLFHKQRSEKNYSYSYWGCMSQLNSFTCHFIATIARSRTFFDNLKCVKQSPLSFAVDRYIFSHKAILKVIKSKGYQVRSCKCFKASWRFNLFLFKFYMTTVLNFVWRNTLHTLLGSFLLKRFSFHLSIVHLLTSRFKDGFSQCKLQTFCPKDRRKSS